MNQELETRSALSANSLMSVMPGHSSSFVAWAHTLAEKLGATEEQVFAVFASENKLKVGDCTIEFDPATQRVHFTRPARTVELPAPTLARVRPPAPAKKEISQTEIVKLVHKKQADAEERGQYLTTAAATHAVYTELGLPLR